MRKNSQAAEVQPGPAAGGDVARLLALVEEIGERRSLRDPIASLCESLALTAPQTHALLWLGKGPLTMGELARRLGVSEKAITGVVDRLEREGHLKRERDAHDRRVVRTRLTRKGLGVSKKLSQNVTHHLSDLLGMLTAQDRQDLFRILGRIRDQFDAPAYASSSS